MTEFYFRSDLFQVEPGEDNETNPQRYGKQLSQWLKMKLEKRGYPIEEVIPEDWGWCVMCQRQPYSLWVGCGNMDESESVSVGKGNEITWQCFVVAEVPFLRKFFGRPNTAEGINKLTMELEKVLASEPRISLVNGP
jgi:hypothetical protein